MDVYMNATPSDLRLCRPIWKRMLPLNANSLSERKGDLRSRKIARFGLVIPLFIVLNISLLKDDSVAKSWSVNTLKQYAFIELNHSFTEFYCLDELWHKESRWNYKAKNPKSSAFGIPQILGLKEKNPIKQIDKGLAYIKHRYDEPCKALQHHKIKGWY
jgi:hypothetical protein